MPAFDLTQSADMLKWIFLTCPHYALGSSLYNMNQVKIATEVCRIQCERMHNTSINVDFDFDLPLPIPQNTEDMSTYALLGFLLVTKYGHIYNSIDIMNYIKRCMINPVVNGTALDLHVKCPENLRLTCDPDKMCGEYRAQPLNSKACVSFSNEKIKF